MRKYKQVKKDAEILSKISKLPIKESMKAIVSAIKAFNKQK